MKRFILLSFGFLGWAFYEMSGGDEFESASDRQARLNPAPAVTVTQVDNAALETLASAETKTLIAEAIVDTTPPVVGDVTRVALNLTTLEDAADAADAPQTQVANVDATTGVAINTDTSLSSADTPAIIPSLIAPADSGSTNTIDTASLATDVRTVSGNRVNVRGGPSTDFGIVSRLVRGDAVEVIEDNGNGWVRMRPVNGGDEGWMADFLLTAG